MPHDRFYRNASFHEGMELTLDKEEAHHLKVMRLKPGETIELINGKGDLAKATLLNHTLRIDSVVHEPEAPFQIILAQSIPRFSRLDAILEKGTELGMTALWLFPGEKSEKTVFSTHQKERMEKILIAALKQCGRLYLPQLEIFPSIQKWTSLPYPTFFGELNEKAPSFSSLWKKSPPEKGAIFVIGPESGLTEAEEQHLKSLHAQGVTLHKNILRTDTAPLAALVLMNDFIV